MINKLTQKQMPSYVFVPMKIWNQWVRFYSKPFSRFWGGFWESRFYYTLTGKKLHLSADSNPLLIKLRWLRVFPFEHLYSLRHGGTALGESQSDLKYLLLFHVPLSFIRKKRNNFISQTLMIAGPAGVVVTWSALNCAFENASSKAGVRFFVMT